MNQHYDTNNSDIQECFEYIPKPIQNYCTIKHYAPGQFLYHKGDFLHWVLMICTGNIKSINVFDTGNTYTITDNGHMDFLGDIAALANQPASSITAYAVTDCTVIQIPHKQFIEWVECDSRFSLYMLKRISKILYHSSDKNGRELFYPAINLVAIFLCDYGRPFLADHWEAVTVSMTRTEISQDLGMTVRTVDRSIQKLKAQNLVSIHKGKICFTAKQAEQMSDLYAAN